MQNMKCENVNYINRIFSVVSKRMTTIPKFKTETETKPECFMSSQWTNLQVWLLFIIDEIIHSAALKQDEINWAGFISVLQYPSPFNISSSRQDLSWQMPLLRSVQDQASVSGDCIWILG